MKRFIDERNQCDSHSLSEKTAKISCPVNLHLSWWLVEINNKVLGEQRTQSIKKKSGKVGMVEGTRVREPNGLVIQFNKTCLKYRRISTKAESLTTFGVREERETR